MTEQERIQSIIKNGGRHLQCFSPENITYDMCLAAVKDDGSALVYVPSDLRSPEIYAAACHRTGAILKDVPLESRSLDICLQAVQSDGMALQYVPEENKTEDICYQAVCSDALSYRFVPPEVLNESFCMAVIKKEGLSWINSFPSTVRNSQLYMKVLDDNPEEFGSIPKKNRTGAICKKAIKALGYSSTYEAVKADPSFFLMLHPSLYDHDSCLAFVSSDFFYQEMKYINRTTWILDGRLEIDSILRWYSYYG